MKSWYKVSCYQGEYGKWSTRRIYITIIIKNYEIESRDEMKIKQIKKEKTYWHHFWYQI